MPAKTPSKPVPKTPSKPAPKTPAKAPRAVAPKPATKGRSPAASPKTAAKAAPRGPPPLPSGTTQLTLGATKATVLKGKTTSLRLVRTLKAPAQRIYDCFLDADAMVKWLPPHGFTGHIDHHSPKVGGGYRMSFATLGRTWGHTFTGTYLELIPGKRLRYVNAFLTGDPVMAGAQMQVTIDLKPVPGGTEVTILQEGIPAGPSADGAPYGWSQSLDNLANLCEADLPF